MRKINDAKTIVRLIGIGTALGYVANRYLTEDKIDSTKAKIKGVYDAIAKKIDDKFGMSKEFFKDSPQLHDEEVVPLDVMIVDGDDRIIHFTSYDSASDALKIMKEMISSHGYVTADEFTKLGDGEYLSIPENKTRGWTNLDEAEIVDFPTISISGWYTIRFKGIEPLNVTNESASCSGDCEDCTCHDDGAIDPRLDIQFLPIIEFDSQIDALKAEIAAVRDIKHFGSFNYADLLFLRDGDPCTSDPVHYVYGWRDIDDFGTMPHGDKWIITTVAPTKLKYDDPDEN